jgi:hypothetical protein
MRIGADAGAVLPASGLDRQRDHRSRQISVATSSANLRAAPAVGLLAALALAGLAVPALAADTAFRCAPLLPSANRAPAYGRVAGQARCEGYFDQTVSQPFIELLSLTRQRPGAPTSAPAVIQIRSNPSVAARLVIQPLAPSPFYRVDAALETGSTLTWDPGPMLASTGLRLADLGLLARARPDDAATLAVVPLSLPPSADEAVAYAVLRVSVPVASMASRSYRPGGGDAAPSPWRELPGTPLYAWETIVLPIQVVDDGQDRGIDVRAVGKDGRPLPLLQFVVVGK